MFWISPLAADTIILALTLTRILSLVDPVKLEHDQSELPTKNAPTRIALLYKTLARYGVLYFLAVQGINTATLIAYAQGNGAVKNSKSPGNIAFQSIAVSRLVLSLFTVNSASPCRPLSPLREHSPSTYPPTTFLSSELDTTLSSTAYDSNESKRGSLSSSTTLTFRKARQSLTLPSSLTNTLPQTSRERPSSIPMLLTPPSSPCKIILTPPPSPHIPEFSPRPSPLSFDQERRPSITSIASTARSEALEQPIEDSFSFCGTSPIVLEFGSLGIDRSQTDSSSTWRRSGGRFSLTSLNRLSRILF